MTSAPTLPRRDRRSVLLGTRRHTADRASVETRSSGPDGLYRPKQPDKAKDDIARASSMAAYQGHLRLAAEVYEALAAGMDIGRTSSGLSTYASQLADEDTRDATR